MRTPDDILQTYKDRKAKYHPLHAKMTEIADVYNGDVEIPLPDFDRENDKPSIPNLLQQGVDQMAGRIASVTPQVIFSSKQPGVRKYDRISAAAAQTVTGWWQGDRLMLKQKVRARRLIAYAMAPTVLRWDFKEHRPVWEVRHPTEALPSYDLQPGQVRPSDCIFTLQRTAGWLIDNGYGPHLRSLVNSREEIQRDARVTLLEYMDGDQTTLLATGYYPNTVWDSQTSPYGVDGLRGVVLEHYATLCEDSPVVIPTRLTLDKMTGQFDGMLGMFYQQAKLMALETIAVEKGIFPDMYLVSRPGELGKIVDGPHDGRTGLITVVQGGDIKSDQTQPGYMTQQTIDRLERAQRVTSGIPSEFGGESGTNIRTGRRGDAILSATIDFPIAEAQEIFAFAMEEENEAAIQLAKRIDGDTPRTIYVGTGNTRKPVTYKANETFEVEEHVVAYPAAGTDVNSLVIGLGQRVGLGIMSKRTAAELDPYIDNAEGEHDHIIAEGLEQALMSGIQQQAASGQIPPLVLAKIMSLVSLDKMELAEAMNKVTEDALKEQQKQAEQQAAQQPQQMTPEMAMAGAAAGAMTGNPTVAPIAESMPGMDNLGQMLGALRKPGMTIVPGRNVPQGGM